MPQPVDLAFDCEICGLEDGALETYDPLIAACRFGVPARTFCRLCAHERRGSVRMPDGQLSKLVDVSAPGNQCPGCASALGPEALDAKRCPICGAHAMLDLLRGGMAPRSLPELLQAVTPWAQAEGFRDLGEFFSATFVESDPHVLLLALANGVRIETVPDPFDRQGGARGGAAGSGTSSAAPEPAASQARTRRVTALPDAPIAGVVSPAFAAAGPLSLAEPVTLANPTNQARTETRRVWGDRPPPSAPPRAVLYPLVSVIAADGEIDPRERALVDRFLLSEGLAPLQDDEIRVHSPAETAPLVSPARRHDVIQLMCETASIDGAADAAEIRVIRAYAGAWGVPDEQVDLWLWAHENMTEPFARQMWKKIRRFVLSSRWEEAK